MSRGACCESLAQLWIALRSCECVRAAHRYSKSSAQLRAALSGWGGLYHRAELRTEVGHKIGSRFRVAAHRSSEDAIVLLLQRPQQTFHFVKLPFGIQADFVEVCIKCTCYWSGPEAKRCPLHGVLLQALLASEMITWLSDLQTSHH